MENVIIKFVADTSGLKPAIDQLQLLGKISEADAASFAKINDEQKEFIQNLNKSTTEFGKLNSEVEGLMAEIQAGVMEGFADHLAEVTAETKKAGTGFKSMKAELRELKAQISSGSLGEKELREATKRAAELQDTIGDVNDKVKALASDTKRIDAVVTAFRGIAAAASVAAGAAALFGNENEKLTKTLAQAQGAMALLQGVQELANIATTEGALRTMVLDGAQKAVAVSARVMGTSIATATAVATAGITLLVAGLAYLVTEMMFAEDESAKLEKKLATVAGNKDLIDKSNKIRIELIKNAREQELELLKLSYEKEKQELIKSKASGDEIERYSILLHKKYLQDVKDINDKHNKQQADAAIRQAEHIARIQKQADDEFIKKQLLQIRDQIANYEILMRETTDTSKLINYYAEIIRLRKAQIQLDNSLTNNEKILRQEQLNDELEKYKKTFEKRTDLDIKEATKAGDGYVNIWIDRINRVKKLQADAAKYQEEQAKMWTSFAIDQAKVVSDTVFTINQNRRNAETEQLLTSLNEQRDAELSNKNLTDAQRLQIEKRYQEQERRLKQQAFEADRAAAIAQAIINGALAVSKTLAVYGWTPAAAPGIIAATVATAAQIAVIQSTPIPQFADGTEFLVGKGTGRSDSNLAYLSHGERVVPAGINSDYFPALSAIQNRDVEPTFANNILTALANGTFDLAAQFQGKQQQADQGFDYDKLGKVLARNKSSVNIQMDEAGYTKYLIKENSKVEFRNTKLRLKN